MIRFVIGGGLALTTLLSGYVLEGGTAMPLLGFTAFLVSFFIPLFAVLAVWPLSAWLAAWRDALGKPTTPERSVAIWKFSEVACYIAGVLASLTGGVLIMNAWEAPPTPLARAFGALLVGPLYGTFFALICRILRARVESRS